MELHTARLFPEGTDFLNKVVPTPDEELSIQSVQLGNPKVFGNGEFFNFQITTKQTAGRRPQLRFCLEETTFNSKIFSYGKTCFNLKAEDVIQDICLLEESIQAMNLFPDCVFTSLLKRSESIFRGETYKFTAVRTKVTNQTGIFENGVKSSVEELQQSSNRKATAILLLTGVFRDNSTHKYHICSRLEQLCWKKFNRIEDKTSPKKAIKRTQLVSSVPSKTTKLLQMDVNKAQKWTKMQQQLERLGGSFMKYFFENQMEYLLLEPSEFYEPEKVSDQVFLHELVDNVLEIEKDISEADTISLVLDQLIDKHGNLTTSYNRTYQAQPVDACGWTQMRTIAMRIQIFDIYCLILKSSLCLDSLKNASPTPNSSERFQQHCESLYKTYHHW